MAKELREVWVNCIGPDDTSYLGDEELAIIDAMEDSIAPLDKETTGIRGLITRFESCYHEADKEAEHIVKAIGAGRRPAESNERPAKRKRELENCRDILRAWCDGENNKVKGVNVGVVSAEELFDFIGERTALKVWQVERIVDRVSQPLDPKRIYHTIYLDMRDYGVAEAEAPGEHYKEHSEFLKQTIETIILDTVDGSPGKISMALAIDLLQPCNWNFVNNVIVILKAVGGNIHPDKPFACCSRNLNLSPLRNRLKIISDTLRVYWKSKELQENADPGILTLLGKKADAKRWLAASLDKTIRLQWACKFPL
jgi:hypothetical protein